MTGYGVIIEGGADGYSAYVPDLPGCIAAGESLEIVQELIAEAVEAHVASLEAAGEPVPAPSAVAATVVST